MFNFRAIIFFILLCILTSRMAFGLAEKLPPASSGVAEKPVMIFTCFPSAGYSEMFRRVLSKAYSRLGYNVLIERLPAERALVTADSGEVDGEAGRLSIIEKSFHHLVRVPTPHYFTRLYVWSKNKNLDMSKGWSSVRKYKLGTLTGYKYVESQTYDMDRVLVPSYQKLLEMLENERLDIVILSLFDALPVMNAMGIKDIYRIEPPLGVFPMYHYLHKKHAELVPEVDRVFLEMQESGELDAIVQQAISDLGSH